MNLGEIYSSYIGSQAEDKIRDQKRLYVTDLGKCHRQVAYRLLGAEKNEVSEQTKINDSIMFDLAEHLESKLADALEHQGKLIAYQESVPMPDRENWGGRLDIIADYEGARVIEVKSVRSNKFNYADELPDVAHALQASVYDHYIREEGHYVLSAHPLLWYVDRGGSNTPLEFNIDYMWEEIASEMDDLDYMRTKLSSIDSRNNGNSQWLPDRLPKVLKLRSYGKKIMYEPPWNCGYCDYSDACSPDMRKSEWANFDRDKGLWIPTRNAHIIELVAFAEEYTTGKVGDAF